MPPEYAEAEIGYMFSPQYEMAIDGVAAGIINFLERPENDQLYLAIWLEPLADVYLKSVDDEIYTAMDAEMWMMMSGCPFDLQELWVEGFYQVAAQLCLPDAETFYE